MKLKQLIYQPIRSYVRREGRMTAAQKAALHYNWPRYGLILETPADIACETAGQGSRVLEIGFGNGSHLLHMAQQHPDMQFIGIEVHRPGIGTLLHRLAEQHVTNVQIYAEDAVEVLKRGIPNHCLTDVQIFFPDPWQKRRHHKRRLINETFTELLYTRLAEGGRVHLATDWEDYADQMMRVFSKHAGYVNPYGLREYAPPGQPERLPRQPTAFEARGLKLGLRSWDMLFVKT